MLTLPSEAFRLPINQEMLFLFGQDLLVYYVTFQWLFLIKSLKVWTKIIILFLLQIYFFYKLSAVAFFLLIIFIMI